MLETEQNSGLFSRSCKFSYWYYCEIFWDMKTTMTYLY